MNRILPLSRALALTATLLLAAAGGAGAQQTPTAAAPAAPDTVAQPAVTARGALIRSLVLPGWGQSYVGAPGRGSIYFALEAGSLWMAYKTNRELGEARELQAFLRERGELEADETLGLVDAREEQMEDWLFLSGFILLFSGADAYVAAQLADFDERVGVRPAPGGGVQLEARLPIPRRR